MSVSASAPVADRARGPRSRSHSRGRGRDRDRGPRRTETTTSGDVTANVNGTADPLPSPSLFPPTPLPLTSLCGSWSLIASTAPIWQARRDAVMTINEVGDGNRDHEQQERFNTSWTYYELGSFKCKTLLTRIAEHRQRRRDARENGGAGGGARAGETRGTDAGHVWAANRSDFCYAPLSAPLGRKVKWQVIGWGDLSSGDAGDDDALSRAAPPPRTDWFIAYVHSSSLSLASSPLLSIYIRQDLMRSQPNTARILFRDIVEELGNVQVEHGGYDDDHAEHAEEDGDDTASASSSIKKARQHRQALQWELRRMALELKLARGIS